MQEKIAYAKFKFTPTPINHESEDWFIAKGDRLKIVSEKDNSVIFSQNHCKKRLPCNKLVNVLFSMTKEQFYDYTTQEPNNIAV